MERRSGHSLIELLVVLIIVGVLIAIVVPAVQRSRESARMAQCIHNQGQLAKAVHMHLADEPYGRFPGYRAFGADGTTVVGWSPQVFEYLGKSNQPNNPDQGTFIEVLVCPSDSGPTDTPRLNYVVNGGQAGLDSAADGIFFDHAKNEKVYISKDDFRDGLTNTILLAENLDATQWNVTDESDQCILWPLVAGNEVNHGTGARPSSHHPGGFVAAFADGSVKFMSETDFNEDDAIGTEASLYVAMLTPGGNDSGFDGGSGGSEPGDTGSGCGDLADGLAARWTFNSELLPFDDEVGSYHGTPQSVALWRDGSERDGVLVCPGANPDWVEIGNVLEPGSQSYSISVWYQIDSTTRTHSILRNTTGATTPGYMMKHHEEGVATNGPFFHFANNGSGHGVHHAGFHPGPTEWTHFVAIIDREAGEFRTYINTSPEGGDCYVGSPDCAVDDSDVILSTHPLGIAHPGFASYPTIQGRLDDMRIYTRVLEDCEIAALYNGGSGLPQDGVE